MKDPLWLPLTILVEDMWGHRDYLDFPMDTDELRKWQAKEATLTYVSADTLPTGIDMPLGAERPSLAQINALARIIDEHPEAANVVEEAIDCGATAPTTALELANMLAQASDIPLVDLTEVLEDVPCDPDEAVGTYLAEVAGLRARLRTANIEKWFDYAKFGHDMAAGALVGLDSFIPADAQMPALDAYSWEEVEALCCAH